MMAPVILAAVAVEAIVVVAVATPVLTRQDAAILVVTPDLSQIQLKSVISILLLMVRVAQAKSTVRRIN